MHASASHLHRQHKHPSHLSTLKPGTGSSTATYAPHAATRFSDYSTAYGCTHTQGDSQFQAAVQQAGSDPARVFAALYDLSLRDPEALLLPVLKQELRLPFHAPPSRALTVAEDPDKCR
jgi:hypothetical protein